MYRILYVEDNMAHIAGIEKFLEGNTEYQIIVATSWEEAQIKIGSSNPNLLLLDQGVDDKYPQDLDLCIKFIKYVREKFPHIPIIIFSTIGYLRPEIVLAALRFRASYLIKQEVKSGEMLSNYFNIALKGDVVYSQTATTYFNELLIDNVSLTLTSYEQQIAQLISKGLTNKQIASRLGKSPLGIRDGITRILQKTNQKNRAGIVAWYMKNYPNVLLDDEP